MYIGHRVNLKEKILNSTEQKILAAAGKLFFHFGFKKTSVDEIAAEAGVGKGTIYNYFSNKEELFKKLIFANQKMVRDAVEKEIAHLERADDRLLQRNISELANFRGQSKAAGTTPAMAKELRQTAQALEGGQDIHNKGLYDDMTLGMEQGIFKQFDAASMANTFSTMLWQFSTRWMFLEESESKKEQRAVLSLMIDGIRA